MDTDKSIFEKITDTVKNIANIAADAASQALKAEEPPLKADQSTVAYMPLAGDGLVSDPLLVASISTAPRRKRKRAAPKPAAKRGKKATAKKAPRKSARKSAKKPAARKRGKAVAKNAGKASRKTAKKAPNKARTAKRSRRG